MISHGRAPGHRPSDAAFDAYLKFIEDRFIGGARIDPRTDGWPDRARRSARTRRSSAISTRTHFDQQALDLLILDLALR